MRASTPPAISGLHDGLFEGALADETLLAAWYKVRDNQGAAGGDGIDLRSFERGLAGHLVRLKAAVIGGEYRPGPARVMAIPKRSGGTRTLRIPCIGDRVLQTAVTLAIGPLIEAELEDDTYAYRPGRSVRMAVARIDALRRQGYGWVVEGDIRTYFDSIPHAPLLERLRRTVRDGRIVALVGVWLTEAFPEGRGIPQGAPISPCLANLYLDALDEALGRGPARIVRFADDFVVLCRSPGAAASALDSLRKILAAHGLELHPDKTRIVPFEKGFTFLGHLFVRSLVTRREENDEAFAARVGPTTAAAPAATAPVEMPTRPIGGLSVRSLYLASRGLVLGTRGESFVLRNGETLVAVVPPANLERIEAMPGTEVLDDAMRLAFAHGVAVFFLGEGGHTVGCAGTALAARARTAVAQALLRADPAKAAVCARAIVAARIFNERALLRRLNRKVGDARVDRACTVLTGQLRRAEFAKSVDVARGHEGAAASAYWPALGRLVRDFPFDARCRRPPRDPANLILSFVTALLHRKITALLPDAGLHPGIGVLHTTLEGDHACASDIIEALRGPFCEALAVTLLNARILQAPHFIPAEAPGDPPWRLTPDGNRAVIRMFEQWLARPITNPRWGIRTTWAGLVADEVTAYRDHVLAAAEGAAVAFKPFRTDH